MRGILYRYKMKSHVHYVSNLISTLIQCGKKGLGASHADMNLDLPVNIIAYNSRELLSISTDGLLKH